MVYTAFNMGNKYIDQKGYPRWKDSGRLVHRTVAANKVGGRLFSNVVVHHIDGNKMNFRKDNLWVMSRSAHARLHANQRKYQLPLVRMTPTYSGFSFVSN